MSQENVSQKPPNCASGLLVICLVDWNSRTIDWHGPAGGGIYKVAIESQGREIIHDFHKEPVLVVPDVEPGKAGLEFIGDIDGLAASLEHLPVPTYDDRDVEEQNGNAGAQGASSGAAPVTPGCPILEGPLKAWARSMKFSVAPSEELPGYSPEVWISHAERDARKAGHWFHMYPYEAVAEGNGPPIIMPIDLKETYKDEPATVHFIELTGRYAYVPWLEETTAPAHVNAANLAALADLAYGTMDGNENRVPLGGIEDVFRKMENLERPERCNASASRLVLRTVPYALRYKTEDVNAVFCRRTQFRAFLAFSPESAILGVSGLGKDCYEATQRETNPQWRAAANFQPLPFFGLTMDPRDLELLTGAVDAGAPTSLPGLPPLFGKGLPVPGADDVLDKVKEAIRELIEDRIKDGMQKGLEYALGRNLVHRGVYHAAFGLWDGLRETVDALPQVPVFVGASCYGGPAAGLLGLQLAETGRKIYLHTFGGPQALGDDLCEAVTGKLACAWRYEAYKDRLSQDPSYGRYINEAQVFGAGIRLAADLGRRSVRGIAEDIYDVLAAEVDVAYFPLGEQRFHMHTGNGTGGLVYTAGSAWIALLNAKESRGYLFAPFPVYPQLLARSFGQSAPLHRGRKYVEVMARELSDVYLSLVDAGVWSGKCLPVAQHYYEMFEAKVKLTEAEYEDMRRRSQGWSGPYPPADPTVYFPYERMQYQEDSLYVGALSSESEKVRTLAGSPPPEHEIRGTGGLVPELRRELEILSRTFA